MQLNFEVIKEVGTGNYPDLIHFANTQAQVFNIDDGKLSGMPSDLIDNGEWEDVTFQDEVNVSPDDNMTHFEVKVLPGFGIIGGYKTGDTHKLIIYEFAFEMDAYLNSGSIKHSIDNPISSFTLSLENPDLKDPEKPGNVALSEKNSLLSPGAKILFKFGAGNEESEFDMGTFYVDRSNFALLSETASVDGRNRIGKVLKDQTIDEKNEYWYDFVNEHIKTILEQSGLQNYEYLVETTEEEGWFSFSPNTTPLKAIENMIEVLPQWKVRELADGTIVIGSENYSGFEPGGAYVFYRNKDIFSRQITRDDAEAYNRVCVYTANFAKVVFRDVANFQSWSLQSKKTLYVQVSDGLLYSSIEEYADELAARLENVGKLESFDGPFRPHLQVGDEAVIVDADGSKSLGLITEVTHNFGKSGFYTNFTVDSGGKLGKGRLSDFISKIALGSIGQKAETGYDDIDMTSYINLSKFADVATSSKHTVYNGNLMKDGKKDATELSPDAGWRPSRSDEQPWIEFRFKQRCLVDKIMLWLALDDEDWYEDYLPTRYTIQYWNGAFWNDLVEAFIEDIEPEMVHTFSEVETSAIRFVLTQQENRPVWREVEIWGYM